MCVCVCVYRREVCYVKVRENQHERRLLYKCYSGLGHSADHFNNCLFWKCAPFSKRCSVTGNNRPYGQRRGAEAHLNSPLWKESRMRGDRESSTRIGMRSEEERLQTFQNWPTDAPVSPAELARAGFHYLGYGDTVQCFCCDGILRHWVHGDTPRGEHERHFPACRLMLGRDVGNVPLGSVDSVDGQLLSQLQRLTMDEQVLSGQAVYPERESEDSRLSTYHNWPTGASVQPDALAQRASSTQVRPRLQQG